MKRSELNISIVIPTFHRPHLALSLANNIRKIDHRCQITIVDQENSDPPTARETEKQRVQYFNLDKANTSVAKNKGISESRGDIVIFFDDDVEITKKTMAEHIAAYGDPSVVGASGRVINDGETHPSLTAVDTGKTNWLGTKFLLRFWSTKKQNIDFPYGCNMSFRRDALAKIGGFDTHFPKIFEEVDLGYRINKLGKIAFLPDALVYHHKAVGGGIRPEEKANKQKLIFRNYGYYLAKNVPFPFSLISLLLRMRTALMQSPAAIFDLLKGYCQSIVNNYWLLAIVFALIAFVRLWKVPNFYIFTFSEEWQASLAWEQVKNFHPIWIGLSHANINYYQGPGFIYLHYFLYLLGRGNPVILAYAAAALGIVTTIFLYKITKELFSAKVAIFTSLFYGCSTLINFYDRRFWNPSPIPLITLLFIYSLIKKRKNTRWYILTAFLVGISFHFHIALLLFLIPTLYTVIRNFKKIRLSTYLLSFTVYLILTSPLIVFDFVHNFDNLLMPYRIIFGQGKHELYSVGLANMIGHGRLFLSTLGRIWFTAIHTNLQDLVLETNNGKIPGQPLLSLLSLIALAWFFWKNRRSGYQIFFISLLTLLAAFIVYPSYNPEYYLSSFITLMAIVIGYWLASLPKLIGFFIVVVFIVANLLTVVTTTDDYGLVMKKRFIAKTMAVVGRQSFRLETTGPLPNPQYAYAGWRMLFKAYGRTPARSNVDSVLGWIYPNEIAAAEPAIKVIVSETPLTFKQSVISQYREGVYYGYVVKNE